MAKYVLLFVALVALLVGLLIRSQRGVRPLVVSGIIEADEIRLPVPVSLV